MDGLMLEIEDQAASATGADTASRVRSYLDAGRIKQSALARQAGVNPGALSAWLAGKYAGDVAAIEVKLAAWFDQEDRRSRMPATVRTLPDFVETPTAAGILNTLSYAQIAGDAVLIVGEPGIGKTLALKQYATTRPNAWLATMSPDTRSPTAMLCELGTAIGIRDLAGGAAPMRRQIESRIATTGGLLLIDEAQHLRPAALETLRTIHDRTGIGLALCGNVETSERIDGFAQLSSRIGKRMLLTRPAPADVAALAEAFGFAAGGPEQAFLEKIAQFVGGLRSVVKVCRLAAMYADEQTAGLTLAGLRAAWQNLNAGARA